MVGNWEYLRRLYEALWKEDLGISMTLSEMWEATASNFDAIPNEMAFIGCTS